MLAIGRFGIWKVGLFVASIALATRFAGWDLRYPPTGPVNPYLNPIKDSFVGRLDDFYNGILICYLCVVERSGSRRRGGYPLLLVGLSIGVLTMICWDNVALGRLPQTWAPLLHTAVNASLFCIIYALYHLRGRFRRVVFENYPIQLIGMMCYSLYVWHGITNASLTFNKYTPQNLSILFIALSTITVLSYRYVEFGHASDWRKLFLLGGGAKPR